MAPLRIRPYDPDDAPALRALFYAAVHQLARQHYSAAQRQAWAPRDYDAAQWAARLQSNQPFIVLAGDGVSLAGFADLQADGHIDQFFIAPAYTGQGVGQALMAHLQAQAAERGIARLWADVSLTAEAFFTAQGFAVQERQEVERAGVLLRNARMVKVLKPAATKQASKTVACCAIQESV